jgi:hypothetical protein
MMTGWRVALVLGGAALGCSARAGSSYEEGEVTLPEDTLMEEMRARETPVAVMPPAETPRAQIPTPELPAARDSAAEDMPEGTGVAIIWDLFDPRGYMDGVRFGQIVTTTGDVPGAFWIDITQPPRREFLIEMADGNALAIARVPWVSLQGFAPEPGGGWSGHGGVSDHVLVYVRDDVALDSPTASFLHGTPKTGYHMLKVDRPEAIDCGGTHAPDERGFVRYTGTCPRDRLVPAVDDMGTQLSMSPDFREIPYEDLETAW